VCNDHKKNLIWCEECESKRIAVAQAPVDQPPEDPLPEAELTEAQSPETVLPEDQAPDDQAEGDASNPIDLMEYEFPDDDEIFLSVPTHTE